nr:103_t:CDS:2 [Entrophospora candida]
MINSLKANKEDSLKLKKLIEELANTPSQEPSISTSDSASTIDTLNFLHLYHEITKAESRNEKTKQEVIQCYYNFGELLSQCFYFHYTQVKNDQMAQVEVNKEAREQLPTNISEDAFKKRTERARKVYFLFSQEHIGKEKIGLKNIGAVTIDEEILNSEEISENITKLKRKLKKDTLALSFELYRRIRKVTVSELPWNDPLTNQIISNDSDIICLLPDELQNTFMEPLQYMVPSLPSIVYRKCNEFVQNFTDDIGFRLPQNLLHNGMWKETNEELANIAERILDTL